MSEWESFRIKDFGKVVTGKTPPTVDKEFYNKGYKFVTPTDLDFNSYYIRHTQREVSEKARNRYPNYFLPPDSVSYTCIGATIGKSCLNREYVLTNQQINSIIPNKSSNARFIYYYLNAITPSIVAVAGGAATPIVNKSSFESIKINVPPLPTQQKIAKTLSNYDDLIENNLKRIKLLEESARLTYEEWFLRFRIDGKKLDIDPTTDLPFGWSNKSFNSICKKISSGGTPSRANKKYWDFDDYDWVTTKELRDGYIYDTKEKISLLGLEKSSAKLFPKGTIVMAIYASPTLGRLGVITKESCFNQAAVGFIIDENFISNEFLYCKLISERVGLNALAMGAAQQNINLAKVKNYEVVIPDLELLQEFTNVTRPMFNEIENLGLQNQLLKEARDILLPRLMTGMIDTDELDIAV